MAKHSKELNKKVAKLRAGFIEKLADTLVQLDGLVDNLVQDENLSENYRNLEEILHIAHRTGGTAGTFGLNILSTLARSLEKSTFALLKMGGRLESEEVDVLRQLVEAISNECATASVIKMIVQPMWEATQFCPDDTDMPSKTVIIIDDDRELVRLLKIQLTHFGFDIITLSSPRELSASLRANRPSAVVMDVIFPGETSTGVNVIKELREAGQLTCPVLFFSVRDDMITRLSAMRAGCDGFFHKPVDLSQFVSVLMRLTQRVAEEPYRVVLIDDEEEIAEYNSLLLSEAGITTVAVTDPLQAVSSIRTLLPDVILMDVDMPACSGFELVKVIRQYDQFLKIPIIFLTGSSMEDDWLKAILVGGDEFLHKDIAPAELVAAVIARATRARQLSRIASRLSLSEMRYRSVSESARDAIVTADEQGRIVTWNNSAEDLFGYREGEVQGTQVANLLLENDRLRYEDDFKYVEMTGLRKDGSEFPIEVSKSNWVAEDNQYSTNIIRDISTRKNYQQSLCDAKVIAENSSQAKSEFLSGMSHELRTPLNAILGFNQLLDFNPKEPLSPTQKKCVEHIMQGGKHLLALIDDILDLAKIEAGKVELSIEALQANSIIEECLMLVQSSAQERNISLSQASGHDTLPPISADYTRLKQIFLNLFSNAIKYNHEGGEVTVEYAETSKDRLRIAVTDTGIGIPEGKRGELFQPFNRLGAEATEVEGTGIGLSVSKKLVEIMGGSIGFDSEESLGSSFWVELPLASAIAKGENKAVNLAGDQPESTEQVIESKMMGSVLYVEDNAANLSLMEMIVENIEGLDLLSAHNAEIGIDLALNEQPNLIIMDINLPGMDGFEALEKLGATEATAHIPVIALSAAATRKDIEKGMKAGFRYYITKPIQVDEVMGVIHSLLNDGVGPMDISEKEHYKPVFDSFGDSDLKH